MAETWQIHGKKRYARPTVMLLAMLATSEVVQKHLFSTPSLAKDHLVLQHPSHS